jgi:predicted DNA-binding transcriptional regulator AlpA
MTRADKWLMPNSRLLNMRELLAKTAKSKPGKAA